MSNIANLKSYRKGQSGNPAGRPRGSRNVSTILAQMLRQTAPKTIVDSDFVKILSKGRKGITLADAAAARLVYEGVINGKSWALKEVFERTEGKVRERPQISLYEDLEAASNTIDGFVSAAVRDLEMFGKPLPDEVTMAKVISIVAEQYDIDESELAYFVKDKNFMSPKDNGVPDESCREQQLPNDRALPKKCV